jgi:hypothetical protein
MLGAEALNAYPDDSDFGLMGRLYLQRGSRGRLEVKAVEAIPLFNIHARVYPLTGPEAERRIDNLNKLTQQELGPSGIQWNYLNNGWGQYCIKACDPTESLF